MLTSQQRLSSVLLLTVVSLQIGCASKGFNRGELKDQIGISKPVYDDKEIKAAYDKKPNLPRPFKIGVYFATPKAVKGAAREWRWTEQDKAVLAEVGNELKTEGLVSDVFPILDSVVQGDDLRSLRLVAAKHQADALLIVSGAGEIDRYINNAGWSYALLLPAFFVRGSEAETLFISNATMWDVKNEYLYMTAEAEATAKNSYVAAFGKQDKELIDEAKTQSLGNLKAEIKKMIKGTKL
ncbi:MAG: hypothetical protein V4760_16150 [Bdellovibrionota bacterium]